MSRASSLALVLVFAAAACSGDGVLTTRPAGTIGTTTTSTSTSTTTSTTTPAPRDCPPSPQPLPGVIAAADPVRASILLSKTTFPCADHVTIAPAVDPVAAARAAAHAAAGGGPLLLSGTSPDALAAEVERLGARAVSLAGAPLVSRAILEGRIVDDVPTVEPIAGTVVPGTDGRLLLVGPAGAEAWPAVWAAARAGGDTAVLLRGADPRRLPFEGPEATALRASGDAPATWFGAPGEETAWQVDVVRAGLQVPGGGQVLFPGRRLVAFYGQPEAAELGVLGEQGVDGAAATIDRMAPIVASYSSEDVPAVPAFEIIATVASAEATPDGDYSYETPTDVLRPWVEAAGERGVYVILDLQPGRDDFLTQAKLYEEFVRLPHVGIAIDPEWRLEPDEFHLQQIGSVDAAEINAVAEWMAALVREEALPQKLLLLHQFRIDMIPERSLVRVEDHPELAFLVQMDGWGTLADKYATWGALTGQPDAGRLWWGWKNFYDEDLPMATPAEVLELEPTVHYVSFQ